MIYLLVLGMACVIGVGVGLVVIGSAMLLTMDRGCS